MAERKQGMGTFSEFKFKNKSAGAGSQKSGVVPGPTPESTAYEAKDGASDFIPPQHEGSATIAGGIPATNAVNIWGADADLVWHCYEVTFDREVTSVEATSHGLVSTWAVAGHLDVTATDGGGLGANPGPVTLKPGATGPNWG